MNERKLRGVLYSFERQIRRHYEAVAQHGEDTEGLKSDLRHFKNAGLLLEAYDGVRRRFERKVHRRWRGTLKDLGID